MTQTAAFTPELRAPLPAVQSPAASLAPAASPVRTPLQFIKAPVGSNAAKPAFHSSALTGGAPKFMFETETHPVTIADMRPIAETLSLDREGFELLRHVTAVRDLYDDTAVERAYYPEIQWLLRRALGAHRVAIFDVTRRSDNGAGAKNPDGLRGPATRVHVDYTVNSGPKRVRDIFGPEEAARLAAAGARIVQVNVWRPIRGPVERSPLALADASSVRAQDLIATDQIFPDRVGEIYHLAHHPAQRWYTAPRMTPDEVLLIKSWDSLDDGRARFTPHSAFELPGAPANAAPRESIEVRALAVIG